MLDMGFPVRDPAAERRMNFVAAAREAFFLNGYAGTTMSLIASRVGGSKTTLWSYFPSKEELFAAVVDDIVDKFGAALLVPLPLDQDVDLVLRRFGGVLLQTLLSPPILSLYRLVVGEADRFPHLAVTLHERGPGPGKARLALYLKQCMLLGKLRVGDPALAANQFAGLIQCGSFDRELLNLDAGTPGEVADEVEAAVDTFLCAWKRTS